MNSGVNPVPIDSRDRVQRAPGLPLAWCDILLEFDAAPGRRLRMSDLGDRVVLSRTRVSRLVDEMVRSGLVCREANPDDRRSAFAVLTDAGSRRLSAAAPTDLVGIAEHFTRHLTAAELRTVGDALWRVHDRAAELP